MLGNSVTPNHSRHSLTWLPSTIAVCLVVLGVIDLLGWQLDSEFLYSIIHGLPPMVPNAALAFIFTGISLWLLANRNIKPPLIYAGQLFAGGSFLIGVLTIVEYLNIVPLVFFDRLLVPLFSHEPLVLRSSLYTAIAFSLAGTALFLLGYRKSQLTSLCQWLSLLVLITAAVVFFGYVYGEVLLYTNSEVFGIAFPSVSGFILLAIGILMVKPETGLMRAVTATTAGGAMMRRLLPAIVLVSLILGLLEIRARKAGLVTEQSGISLLQSLSIIVMAIIIAYVAGIVNREEKLKRIAEEKSRQHQADLAHLDRLNTMGELAASIAHEVSQPLTAISNYAFASKRIMDVVKNIPPEVLKSLERISVEAGLATEIIQRMREFVRKQCPHKSSIAVYDLLADVIKYVKDDMRSVDVQLKLSLEEQLPEIEIDVIQIEQVLLNIVRNCIEAMQMEGEYKKLITISSYLNKEHNVQIDVCDTGPGMDAKTSSHVFESFFTTKGTKGMGMGLSISRTIVEAHGGQIWVESCQGQGTCFSFTLPV